MGRFLEHKFMGLEPLRAILVAGRSRLIIFLGLVVLNQGRLVEPLRSQIEKGLQKQRLSSRHADRKVTPEIKFVGVILSMSS